MKWRLLHKCMAALVLQAVCQLLHREENYKITFYACLVSIKVEKSSTAVTAAAAAKKKAASVRIE